MKSALFSPFRYLNFLLFVSVTADLDGNWHVGIIYDDGFDQSKYNLPRLFEALKPSLQHYTDISTGNFSLSTSQKFKFTVEKFFINQVCELVNKDVHVIVSLTACYIAEYLEGEAYRYHLLHIAIPRPACTQKKPTVKTTETTPPTTTLWIQMDTHRMAKAFLAITEMERVSHALILADGPTAIIHEISELTMKRKLENERFYTEFSTQLFTRRDDDNTNSKNSNNPMYVSSASNRITLNEFIRTLNGSKSSDGVIAKSYATHIFLLNTKYSHHLDYFKQIFENSNITKKYYWIFDEFPDLSVNHLLDIITLSKVKDIKIGFFRQFPVLNFDDLSEHELRKGTQLLIKSALDGETHVLPERVTIAAYMIMMSNQVANFMKSLGSVYLNRTGSTCDQIDPYADVFGGRLFYEVFSYGSGSSRWKSFWFYSLDNLNDTTNHFIATAQYTPNDYMQLTSRGVKIKQKSLKSGLFSTVFQSFIGKILRISTVLDPPFVVTGQIGENRELFNATGFAIDILNELAIRFNFGYRLFIPENGTYGALNEGQWDGMMGELVNGKVDMIAAGLTISPRRANYVEFIGPIVEDTIGVLVKPSRANGYYFQVFYLFKLDVWISILCSVVILGVTVYLFNKYSPFSGWNLQHSETNAADEASLIHNLWISLRCMLLQGQEGGQVFNCSSRALWLLYWLMILVIHAIWQADLTAFLTKNKLELPIKSLKDLAYNDRMTVLAMKGTSTYNMFQISVNNTVYESVYKKLSANPISINSTSEAVQLVKQYDNYAYITERFLLSGVIEEEETEEIYSLAVIEEPNVVASLGFAAQFGKEFTQPMSSYILTLRERGIIDKFMVKWNMTNDATSINAQYQALTLWNVAGAFIVTGIFSAASLFCLIIECCLHYQWRVR
uniref:Glutamate receptor n=1 Tax=Trichobilharzia regenti TaxID=157069 RepID=A0AA85JTP0_TRIRE|nr:unnamed protein product [Trichobilharzia regenti]